MISVRMDKWLWAARFFKTRSLAARACQLGRIQSNGQPAKAAREVRIGDMLGVTNDGGDFQVEVPLLSEVRGPASVAQTLYRETEANRELRLKVAADRKAMKQFELLPTGRLSKRDRRTIIRGIAWPQANDGLFGGYLLLRTGVYESEGSDRETFLQFDFTLLLQVDQTRAQIGDQRF